MNLYRTLYTTSCTALFTSIFGIASLFFSSSSAYSMETKEHEKWWQECLNQNTSYDEFASWLGDEEAQSRKAMREHLLAIGYQSILDIPCGLATDYFGLKEHGFNIRYQGMDITTKLVDMAQKFHLPVVQGSIENIPCTDSSFDLCYARHILEHLNSYENALDELIRVAKCEVLVVFFIKTSTTSTEDCINSIPTNGYIIYHNQYAKSKLENYVMANPKVESLEWESINDKEEILHIYLQSE